MVVGDFPLRDKICVVTGGGSGINLSFVKLALSSGARVLIPDLRLTDEADKLIKDSKGNAAFTKCDVSKWAELESIPSEVEKAFGKGEVADVWVPGAGIFEPKWSSFLYDQEDEFYMQMRINAEHPIKLTRIAMRSCIGANKPGVVMLVASGAGITGIYAAALYCATKHAVVGFCKSMGQADIDENIKIVCICPGMVATPLWTGDQAKHVNSQFSYSDDVCITSDEVAEGMKEMIESPKWKGGAMMDSRIGNLRADLPSPQRDIKGDIEEAVAEKFYGTLYQPLRDVFAKERGGAANGT